MRNKNVIITRDKNEMYFEIVPFNRELSLNYVAKTLKSVLKHIEKIKEDNINYVISASGYALNGLYETNYLLLSETDSICIESIYTNRCRNIQTREVIN